MTTCHSGNPDRPYLMSDTNTESIHSLVTLIIGHGVLENNICKSIPRNVEKNASFLISTENLKNLEDVRCDDNGSWINNGVRKIYLCIDHHTNPKKLNVTVIKCGGKVPSVPHWCLTCTYFF